jgi:predicted Zn-dependent protease
LVLLTAAGGLAWIWDQWQFQQRLGQAEQEVDRGHIHVAILLLDECLQRRPTHRQALLLSTRVARQSGHLETAENWLDQYWQLYGDDEEVVFERLLLQAARGELEVTDPRLRERERQGGAVSRLIREACVSGLLSRFRWGEAGQLLTAWLADSPEDPWALYLMGRLQEHRDDLESAKEYYRRLVEQDPDHDEARQRLAQLLVQTRHGDEALPHVEHLLTRRPYQRDIQLLWGRTLILLGRLTEAQQVLDSILAEHPRFAAALAERGKVALFQEQPHQAIDYFALAVQNDPGDLAIRHQYATILAQNGQETEAAQQRQAIQQLEADNERIKQLIEGPLQREPNNANVHHEIGMIALRAGQIQEALRWFRSALRIDPQHVPTHRVLMVYYEESGQPALAARHRAYAHAGMEENPKK